MLTSKGVTDMKDFNFAKQVQAVRVEFTPEREKTAKGTFTRVLVDSDELEWMELPPDTPDQAPAQAPEDNTNENPQD